MEKPSLDGCWAKVGRAREHNYRLEQLAERFLKRRPNQITFDDYTDPPWLILRAVVEPAPIEFSAIAGDLVQNLRSALDLLIWQVVLTEGSTPGKHTAFPIMGSEPEFEKRVRNPPEGRMSPLHGIDLAGEKWALVERFQPYNRGEEPVLAYLALFSNRDKHQGLLTAVSFTHAIDPDELVSIGRVENPTVKLTFEPPDALEHNAEILRILAPGARVEVKADPPFEITIGDGETGMGISTFDRIRSEVVSIIRAFEPFF